MYTRREKGVQGLKLPNPYLNGLTTASRVLERGVVQDFGRAVGGVRATDERDDVSTCNICWALSDLSSRSVPSFSNVFVSEDGAGQELWPLACAMELSLSPTTNVVEKGRTQERDEVLRVSISCSVGIVLFTLDMHLN